MRLKRYNTSSPCEPKGSDDLKRETHIHTPVHMNNKSDICFILSINVLLVYFWHKVKHIPFVNFTWDFGTIRIKSFETFQNYVFFLFFFFFFFFLFFFLFFFFVFFFDKNNILAT